MMNNEYFKNILLRKSNNNNSINKLRHISLSQHSMKNTIRNHKIKI